MFWTSRLVSVSCVLLTAPAFAQVPAAAQFPASAPATESLGPAPGAPVAPTPVTTAPTPTPTTTAPTPTPTTTAAPVATPPDTALPGDPPPPPPPDTDTRPNRARRPFFVGGELGWNGLSGLGVNFSYHPEPHFAIDTGAGLSLTGWRVGVRARANLLTSEWTPFLGAGLSFAAGFGGKSIELESAGDKAKLEVLASPFLQLGGGVNYTGSEGFVFTATTGYSILARKGGNTRFVSGSQQTYDDVKGLYGGGLILSVAFGYAF